MKKICVFVLCLALLLCSSFVTAFAADNTYKYHSIIDGTEAFGTITPGCFSSDRSNYNSQLTGYTSRKMQSIDYDADNGLITVTPEPDYYYGEFKIEFENALDLSSLYDIGYIKLKMKSSIMPDEVWGALKGVNKSNGKPCDGGQRNYLNSKSYNSIVTFDNGWTEVLMPINTAIGATSGLHKTENGADIATELYFMFMYISGENAPVDIAEISVVGPDNRPTARVKGAKMNVDGKYEIKLDFNRKIDASTAYDSTFEIDGVLAEDIQFDSTLEMLTIIFDFVPDFPAEYTLNISEGIIGNNGLPVKPDVKFINSVTTETAAMDTANTTCTYSETGAVLNARVNCIYDKTSDGQQITIFAAVFKDNKLVDAKCSETKTVAYKSGENFKVEFDNLQETNGIRMDVYIIDTETSGKPLAKVTSYAK